MSRKGRMARHYHNDGNPIVWGTKIERNDVCPCGSGKKYKKCRMISESCQVCKCGKKMALFARKGDKVTYHYKCESCMKMEGTLNATK